MISLDSILENIIAQIVVIGLSFLISVFLPKIISKNKSEAKFDPLSLALFLSLISIFNLILNLSFWNNSQLTVFLTLSSIGLGYLTYYIYIKQCPSCKKFIRAQKVLEKRIIKRFTRPYKYQPTKQLLYSNGEVWKEKPVGKEKTRIENWVTKQIFYECNYCNFKWDSGHIDENLDEKTRPRPTIEKTNKKDPNESTYSFN